MRRWCSGTDGVRKMSKSAGNTIPIFAEPDEIRRIVQKMVTDPQRIKRTDPGRPEVCNVCQLHRFFGERLPPDPGRRAHRPHRLRRDQGAAGGADHRALPPDAGAAATSWRPTLATSSEFSLPGRPRSARSSRRRWPRSVPPPASARRQGDGVVTGSRPSGIGPRERRWLLAFLVLGSAYFAVLLIQILFGFLGGFSQILLILFLAWLLAFVMSPVVALLRGDARLAGGGGRGRLLVRAGPPRLRPLHHRGGDHPAAGAGDRGLPARRRSGSSRHWPATSPRSASIA